MWTSVAVTVAALSLTALDHPAFAAGPECTIVDEGTFAAGAEDVRLARKAGLAAAANFAVFKAPLAVNTDGAPNSYHSDDFKGQSLAINRIDHGIAIRKTSGGGL